MNDAVQIVEVGPRDGLQSEAVVLPTDHKERFVRDLAAAGLRRIEAASFVRADLVPAMADGEALVERLRGLPVSVAGLVLNRRGAERALRAGVDELDVVVPVTDTFGVRNQGATTQRMLDTAADVAGLAHDHGVPVTITLAVAFACPYEGAVSAARLAEVVEAALALEADELALADTIGVATPAEVTERVQLVQSLGATVLRGHFHDTRRTGLDNVLAAYEAGVRVFDSSVGGLGGCPFAPGAAGNVATEDVVALFESQGVATGIDAAALARTGNDVCREIGITPRRREVPAAS